jgi:hypothetical protein
MTQTKTFPAVEVTLHGCYSNIPPDVWITVVTTTTVYGNVHVLDVNGYDLRVSKDCVRPLGYDVTVAVVDGKLVCTPVSAHADHDTWALISKPGTTWCRTCQQHFTGSEVAS